MSKAVIIDDEPDAVRSVEMLLQEYYPECEVLGKAHNVHDGRRLIVDKKPDVVFLDIEMPDGTGFDLLEGISERNFQVIFITAYNQYALKAFRYSAIDYLLKPVDIDDFLSAVEKVRTTDSVASKADRRMEVLLENLQGTKPEKVALSTSEGMEFVKISEIVQVQGEGSYSILKLIDQSELVVSKNLGEFETILSDYAFFRAHQSHLINLAYVKKVTRHGNELLMEDGSVAFLSRRKRTQFMDLMASLTRQIKA